MTARVYAFKLGGSASRPEIPLRRIPTPKPPILTTTANEYALGTRLYEEYCLTCHGLAAISGGVLPDLRKSGRLQDAALWKRAVVDGDLGALGMPRFGKYVSARDAELVRAYVARQAAMLYEEEKAAAVTP
jgi:mono/diheme cytochrome c family protein